MSILIKDMSLKHYIAFMTESYGEQFRLPKENEKLTLMGCDIIECKAVEFKLENDFRTFGERIAYVCYPIREGGNE